MLAAAWGVPTLGALRRGRGSAGRASPLQGEGQEFESPRLHRQRSRRIMNNPPATSPYVPMRRPARV